MSSKPIANSLLSGITASKNPQPVIQQQPVNVQRSSLDEEENQVRKFKGKLKVELQETSADKRRRDAEEEVRTKNEELKKQALVSKTALTSTKPTFEGRGIGLAEKDKIVSEKPFADKLVERKEKKEEKDYSTKLVGRGTFLAGATSDLKDEKKKGGKVGSTHSIGHD